MSYEVLEIEREDEHCDDPTKDETSIAVKELLERIASEDEETRKCIEAAIAAELEAKAVTIKVICSCGSYTCGAIRTFGHVVPVYRTEIEHLGSQYTKDRRALELKGGNS